MSFISVDRLPDDDPRREEYEQWIRRETYKGRAKAVAAILALVAFSSVSNDTGLMGGVLMGGIAICAIIAGVPSSIRNQMKNTKVEERL